MKKIKGFFKWVVGIVVLLVLLLYITNYEYIIKGVRVVYLTGNTSVFIDDAKYFENEIIPASDLPQPWPKHKFYNQIAETSRLKQTHDKFETVAFLIIKDDSIWHEKYRDGYGFTSKTNSFSMAKSFVSALLGKAIVDGYIKSLDQPISDFYPQFNDSNTTVGDLSSMSSGLSWDESYLSPFSVTARAYYDRDIAETILSQKVIERPGEEYKYLSGNTQLLAMIIEKATEMELEDYLYKSLWNPMGFEHSAKWQVDDEENRLVKAYCCISSNARDFARLGKLYKDNGKWKNNRLLDSSYVSKSIKPRFADSPQYGYGFWLTQYKGKDIFAMRGILGQYVITVPEDDLIIVRLGKKRGKRTEDSFSADFFTYVEESYKMLQKQ